MAENHQTRRSSSLSWHFSRTISRCCQTYDESISTCYSSFTSRIRHTITSVLFEVAKTKTNLNLILVLWKTLIPKYGGVITSSLDVTSLAKLSDSYAPGHIHDTIVETLTERRLAKMGKHPLQASDFIPGLAHHNAIYKEEEDAFKVYDHN